MQTLSLVCKTFIFVEALNIYCIKYCKPIPATSVNKMIIAGYSA